MGKVRHNVRAGPILRSDKLAPENAPPVNQVAFGKAEGAIELVTALLFIVDGEQVDTVLLEELAVGGPVIVRIDGEHDHLRVSALQLCQRGYLVKTGLAPGGPEDQQDNLALIGA